MGDVKIGLEVHAELDTETKLFCPCHTHGSDSPNTLTCPICLGMPGSKPVLNKKVVEYALRLCLATECKIAPELIFSRKTYFYPDMAKNYQITQYEIPIGSEGVIKLENKDVKLKRIHIEEDPAALTHPSGMQNSTYVLVDYNRSGRPLLEIVTEPVLESPEEARDFMKKLITVLNYLDIFDQNECIIKADANISIKEKDFTRVEIKNITGFKEIERALKYEIERQKKEKVIQETRAWDSDNGVTHSLRTKESEDDYGYILDSDLVPIEITQDYIKKIKSELPELAHEKIQRYTEKLKIDPMDAQVIASDYQLAKMFEKVSENVSPILAARWVRRELSRVLNYAKKTLEEVKITDKEMSDLLILLEQEKITQQTAQRIIEKLVEKQFDVNNYVKENNLMIVSNAKELEDICKKILKQNEKIVSDYKSGNEKAFMALVGQVMRETKGKGNPKIINDTLKKLIK